VVRDDAIDAATIRPNLDFFNFEFLIHVLQFPQGVGSVRPANQTTVNIMQRRMYIHNPTRLGLETASLDRKVFLFRAPHGGHLQRPSPSSRPSRDTNSVTQMRRKTVDRSGVSEFSFLFRTPHRGHLQRPFSRISQNFVCFAVKNSA
jgi:hypothetical protein